MIKSSYQLFTLFGIPVKADLSLFILAFLLIQSYSSPLYGLATGIILLISILLHELGHSLVAMAFGCRVRDITLMMMGGCASMLSMPQKAWQEFLMAFAGPLVSLALAIAGFLFAGVYLDGDGHLVYKPGLINEFALYQVGVLNLILFIFNLLPAFPMDGGRILRAFLQQFFMTKVKATWIASRLGRFLAILLAVSVIYSWMTKQFDGYLIIRLLIAYSIYRAAEQEYQMVLAEEGYGNGNPFARFGFPFFGRTTRTPPPDDGQAIVSPPPYERGSGKRVDVRKE
ncbi:MAG: site-2 protease family protein [bacterium]